MSNKNKKAWYISLDRDSTGSFITPRQYRKASAPPTLFSGKYISLFTNHPLVKTNVIKVMHIYVLQMMNVVLTNLKDYKLTLQSQQTMILALTRTSRTGAQESVTIGTENNACAYINEGVLSELVVFGTNLYANVAGPSEDTSTLYRVPALPGDIISNRGGWRDSSY